MSTPHDSARAHIQRVAGHLTPEEIERRLAPKHHAAPPRVPGATQSSPEVVDRRWALLPHAAAARPVLADPTLPQHPGFGHHVENFIGTVKLPIGLAGPLRVNGIAAQGDYYVPLATTEAALVASYHRGTTVITDAGGCSTMILSEGVSRAPAFAFPTVHTAGTFVQWCLAHVDELRAVADATSAHGRLIDLRFTLEANHVYMLLQYLTGDASGQNMVTIATQAVCDHLAAHCPVKPDYFFVESNMSGDKKASAISFQGVRGRKVTAEVRLPRELVERVLRTTAVKMLDYWQMSSLGGVLSGTIGVQGHYANGLAALFIACGQDAACLSEASVGVTRFTLDGDGGLYAAVTLPNLIVGTVGGGTGLPSQRACLEILGLAGTGHARALAEVCAALAQAGELSITAALSAQHFTQAHARLARGRPAAPEPA